MRLKNLYLLVFFFRSNTIDMDCSILYGTEYPVLWMKIGVSFPFKNPLSVTDCHFYREEK